MKFLIRAMGFAAWRTEFEKAVIEVREEGGVPLPFDPEEPPVEAPPDWSRPDPPSPAEASMEVPGSMTAWRATADYLDPHAFFARILGPEQGRRRLLVRLGAEAEDVLDEFLAQALAYEKSAVPSLEGFLHWLDEAQTEIKRDTETLRDPIAQKLTGGVQQYWIELERRIVCVAEESPFVVDLDHTFDAVLVPTANGFHNLKGWSVEHRRVTSAHLLKCTVQHLCAVVRRDQIPERARHRRRRDFKS
jgi:hypothetical protein